MSADTPELGITSGLERSNVRRAVGVSVALAGLLLLLGLAALLPGVDRLAAAMSVSPGALLAALATMLVVGALMLVAPVVETAVSQALDGPKAVVADAATSAKLLVAFATVVVGYEGFAPAAVRLFDTFGLEGVYHLGFLAAGLLVLAGLARRLSRCWDPVTDLLTARIVGQADEERGNASSGK